MKRITKVIAFCGLDCSRCETYLATQADDNDRRAAVAKQWSEKYNFDIKPEHINCDGCLSEERKFFYCSDMCEIRKCCMEKQIANCASCNMYVCDTLNGFFEQVPEARTALDSLRI